jgi:hypothetical protein
MDHYSRPDNALFIPETRGTGNSSRMCFAAIGHGAVGWSPFGLDYTRETPESIAPVGMNYRMLEPIMREVAELNFEGKVKAVQEEPGQGAVTLDFGDWHAVINWASSGGGRGGRGAGAAATNNAAAPSPMGRVLVAQISTNQFFVTGAYCTVDFKAASGGHREFLRVEEAEPLEHKPDSSRDGKDYSAASAFRVMRWLNGDETDHPLSFSSVPDTLRVTLGTF